MIWLPLTFSANVVNVSWQPSWQLDVSAGIWQSGPNLPRPGRYALTNDKCNLDLDVAAASTSAAAGAVQDPAACNGSTYQEWAFDTVGGYNSSGDTTYQIVNLGHDLVMDDFGNDTTAGSLVDQFPSNGGSNQAWTLAGC